MIRSIKICNVEFTLDDKSFVDSLFKDTKTAYGYFKKHNKGVLFLDMQKKPFMYLSKGGYVSCSMTGKGKYYYSFGMSNHTSKKIFKVNSNTLDLTKERVLKTVYPSKESK